MKLFMASLVALFVLTVAEELNFKRTGETEDKNRFESVGLVSNDDGIQKRGSLCIDTCENGVVKSKYCTTYAINCFGSGQVVPVKFKSPFKVPPKVTIGLTLIDTHKDQNVRVHVKAESVTTHGFNVRFKPWWYSVTYQLHVNWMACP
ncbi:uncharacterized protein LOC114517350 [Dendronephthya gigantea]|uniref:uncharacterized protein LOC114517350 n=1 Tax=Dendronephthya gigantea TaxID=151771 RepID=UPI00106B72C3|nr:uncharacterized protein LOC114517350 [Dendronephthya gigantea]